MTNIINSDSKQTPGFGRKQYGLAVLLALTVTLLLLFGKDILALILSSQTTIVTAVAFAAIILTLVFVMHNRAGQLSKKAQPEKK